MSVSPGVSLRGVYAQRGLLPLMPAYDKAWVKIAAFGVGVLSLLLLCPSALALDPSLDVS